MRLTRSSTEPVTDTRIVAAILLAAFTFGALQTTVLPALTVIGDSFDASPAVTTAIFTSFMLSAAVSTPVLAALGDSRGRRRLMLVSIGLCTVGCIGSALARDTVTLLTSRVLQGTGGAIYPLAFALLADHLPAERSGRAISLVAATFAAAGAAGLMLSGPLVAISWRWCFGLGVVLGGIAALAVGRWVPASTAIQRRRIDVAGAATLSGGLVALLVMVSQGASWGWLSPASVGLALVAGGLLAAWLVVERRSSNPLVDVRLMVRRDLGSANVIAFCLGVAGFGSWILVPQLVQEPVSTGFGLGATTTEAGAYLLPGAILGTLLAPVGGRLGQRTGFVSIVRAGAACVALGLTLIALWHGSRWPIVFGMTLVGVGMPSALGALAKLIVDAMPPGQTAAANGVNNVLRTIGAVVGAQALAAVLAAGSVSGAAAPSASAYATALWICAAGAAGAALALVAVREQPLTSVRL